MGMLIIGAAVILTVAMLGVALIVGSAGLVAGRMGVRVAGIGVIGAAVIMAARAAHACGWSTIAMIVPIPVAEDWQMRMGTCDSPGAMGLALLVGPLLVIGIILTACLTWWLLRGLARERSG